MPYGYHYTPCPGGRSGISAGVLAVVVVVAVAAAKRHAIERGGVELIQVVAVIAAVAVAIAVVAVVAVAVVRVRRLTEATRQNTIARDNATGQLHEATRRVIQMTAEETSRPAITAARPVWPTAPILRTRDEAEAIR
jgi:hypothetical protein